MRVFPETGFPKGFEVNKQDLLGRVEVKKLGYGVTLQLSFFVLVTSPNTVHLMRQRLK